MIYLLEDDAGIRELVLYALRAQGFEAEGFEAPADFWQAMQTGEQPELLLLDEMLPGEDGLSVLRRLRADYDTKNLPIILATAKNTEYDRVIGLDSGADDFISKPFGVLELVARVRAVLRRSHEAGAKSAYRVGTLYVCPERHLVQAAGQDVALTNKEYRILCLLLEREGMVLTRGTLMDRVWGCEMDRENRTLDVHIRTLRAKLGSAGRYIQTVRGVGYKLQPPQDAGAASNQ